MSPAGAGRRRPLPERLYAGLLVLFPRDFREELGGDMVQLFREQSRDEKACHGFSGLVRYWTVAVADVVAQALLERAAHGARRPRSRVALRSPHRGDGFMSTLYQDLRYGLRWLVRQPGFTAAAVLSLALGIGANTVIFSAYHAAFLRALPYPDPGRLVMASLRLEWPDGEVQDRDHWSYPYFQVFEENATAFDQLAAFSAGYVNLTSLENPERLRVEYVSAAYFPLLGVDAAVGRTFAPEEDATPGEGAVAILGDGLWRRLRGESPEVLGQTIRLDDVPLQVVGVAPRGFRGLSGDVDVWVPITMADVLIHPGYLGSERWFWHQVVGRLRSDAAPALATAEYPGLGTAMLEAIPDDHGMVPRTLPLDESLRDPVLKGRLGVLLAAVSFVLLIACANVANLLLSRAVVRRREIATRRALGAASGTLVRQFLTEGLLLALLGSAAGLALASFGLRGVRQFLPQSEGLWRSYGEMADTLSIDVPVLLYALGLAVLSGLVFGLAPALQSVRADLRGALAKSAQGSSFRVLGRRRAGSRATLVVGEIALALVLLVGAGLMIRTLEKLRGTDPGFRGDRVLCADARIPRGMFEDPRRDFYLPLLERVRALPGVESASLSTSRPLTQTSFSTFVAIEGRETSPGDFEARRDVSIHVVEREFLRTLSIPLLRGRGFLPSDKEGAPLVVLVNETAARTFWPGDSPLGRRIGLGLRPDDGESWIEVVGLVADARYRSVDKAVPPEVYYSYAQVDTGRMTLFLRSSGDPLDLVSALRREVQAVGSGVPVYDVRPMAELARASRAPARFLTFLLGIFAVVAVALAATGIYATLAFAVAGRRHELGIRMALGATRGSILRRILGGGLVLTGVGAVLGLGAAAALARFLESQLYGVGSSDPVTIGATLVGLGLVATAACYVPARRAAAADPMAVLRDE